MVRTDLGCVCVCFLIEVPLNSVHPYYSDNVPMHRKYGLLGQNYVYTLVYAQINDGKKGGMEIWRDTQFDYSVQ